MTDQENTKAPGPSDLTIQLEQFEQAWREHGAPDPLEFLPEQTAHGSSRRQALIELVMVDLELRWSQVIPEEPSSAPSVKKETTKAGELSMRPLLEDYVARYAELGQVQELPLKLICSEYRVRKQFGSPPQRDEFVRRFPLQGPPLLDALAEIDRQDDESAALEATATFGHSLSETANFNPRKIAATRPNSPTSRSVAGVATFGDYELLSEIAKGGMGVVYKARQVGLDRVVALKMIRDGELAGEGEVERFQTEARAAARLDHSGILPVHEIGEMDGQYFFTMAYVEGGSLQDLIGEGPLPPTKAAELVRHAAEAMQHAHDQGIVHRDLKPANILIDKDGQPKVADFGLAKRLEEDSGLTATGMAVGTPSYMPPEQALGKGKEIGPLADVYSLGAVLYCLLTGRPPFAADNYLETVRQVLNKDPVSPRTLNPAIPKDLETICLKCLRKDQRSRYLSASELADDLLRWLHSEPIEARRVGRLEKSWLWCKRRPVVAGLLAAMVLIVAFGTGVFVERQNAIYARGLIDSLLKADAPQLVSLVDEIEQYQWWTKTRLQQRICA